MVHSIIAALSAVLASFAVTGSPAGRQQTFSCPASASSSYSCAHPTTGCLCVVQGALLVSSKPACRGCKIVYDYTWACTNPFSEGAADGTLSVGCDTLNPPPLQLGTCACDSSALISISYSCGSCQEDEN